MTHRLPPALQRARSLTTAALVAGVLATGAIGVGLSRGLAADGSQSTTSTSSASDSSTTSGESGSTSSGASSDQFGSVSPVQPGSGTAPGTTTRAS